MKVGVQAEVSVKVLMLCCADEFGDGEFWNAVVWSAEQSCGYWWHGDIKIVCFRRVWKIAESHC